MRIMLKFIIAIKYFNMQILPNSQNWNMLAILSTVQRNFTSAKLKIIQDFCVIFSILTSLCLGTKAYLGYIQLILWGQKVQ